MSIIYEIQTAFGDNPTVDVRGVYLDISKTFDKVWHDEIILRIVIIIIIIIIIITIIIIIIIIIIITIIIIIIKIMF